MAQRECAEAGVALRLHVLHGIRRRDCMSGWVFARCIRMRLALRWFGLRIKDAAEAMSQGSRQSAG